MATGDDKNAIKYFKKCWKTNESPYKNQDLKKAFLLNSLGLAYLNFGETDKAIEVTNRSLDVKANDDKMSISFNLLAKCFYYNG